MANQLLADLKNILNGVAKVVRAQSAINAAVTKTYVDNSTVLNAARNIPKSVAQSQWSDPVKGTKQLKEYVERSSTVLTGIQQFAKVAAQDQYNKRFGRSRKPETKTTTATYGEEDVVFIREEDLEHMFVKSLGSEVMQQNEDGKKFEREDLKKVRVNAAGAVPDVENVAANVPYVGKVAFKPLNKEDVLGLGLKQGQKSKSEQTASREPAAEESVETVEILTPPPTAADFNTGDARMRMNENTTPVGSPEIPPPIFGAAAEPLTNLTDEEVTPEKDQIEFQKVPVSTKGLFQQFKPPVAKKFRPLSKQQEQKPVQKLKPLSKDKPVSHLPDSSKERKVPASRIGRLASYGGLAAGLGVGAVSEIAKRSLGLSEQPKDKNGRSSLFDSTLLLNEANAERIVDTLCKVRGAALKVGQILSLQDDTTINPHLQKVFERVRQAADFMPLWQMEEMMSAELGPDWRSKFAEFEDIPFAAASIGQVHIAKLKDGRPVALKIQYPGVAKGIESDIDNLVAILNVWNIIPQGVFVDNLISVAKRELAWEVDYVREAECARRFRQLLEPFPELYVPEVISEFSTGRVYCTELIDGQPVDKCDHLDQETRDRICYLLLDLFFRELYEFRFMQTDPNWSNFLYNSDTKQVGLIDFGASREYKEDFVDKYVMILKGAAEADREQVLQYSRKIGFLTGYESKVMEQAHIDTVMILGEAFRIGDKAYDFGSQDLTRRVQELVPVMVTERLCPPPEEVYSLHRKLSGMFLLCTRLKGRVKCRPIFDRIWEEYQSRKMSTPQ